MTTLTPEYFVTKWKRATARERQAAQSHFLDLCALVGHPTPIDFDPTGEEFAFEMGATKAAGGQGWADVAKLGYFACEYKGKHGDLDKAYVQLLRYRDSLQNPPLLIVSDIDTIIIRTNYTNYKTQIYTLTLDDLQTPQGMQILRAVFYEPDKLKPRETLQAVTEKAAREFTQLATNLRKYGEDPQQSAHFLIRILFCLFAQDIGLLPTSLFARLIEQTRNNSRDLKSAMQDLFAKMSTGGFYGVDRIPYIDGGLFDDEPVLQLDSSDIQVLQRIDKMDWAFIEPSIFGTLFERGLDPEKRSQLGAHYTSKEDIMLIVEPVLMAPLRARWAELKQAMQSLADERDIIRKNESDEINTTIRGELEKFSQELASISVLDPACGSGNFLYVALRLLLDLQKEVSVFGEYAGVGRIPITVSPIQLHGIETNDYAHELAQLTIWIGYIQWRVDNGYGLPDEPILQPIDSILHIDAILGYDENGKPVEPEWPSADVIVGNPPFLGGNRIRGELGNRYVDDLFKLYEGRVPAFADLVCYWFEKASSMIEKGISKRAGLLATNSIRGGVNRRVLEKIKTVGDIFWAQSDRDWILDGAAVNVSMIAFDNGQETNKQLDGRPVDKINPDLTAFTDITKAKVLTENKNISFQGPSPKAPFDIDYAVAKRLLEQHNINGRPNSDVVKPVASAIDLVQGSRSKWTIYFAMMPLEQASQYEAPFEYVKREVLPVRETRRDDYRGLWWQYARPRPEMTNALVGKKRFIATPRISKHRIFVWLPSDVLANDGTIVFARDDDYFFGVLHSKLHEIWALKQGTSLEDRPRYTPTTSFETFPLPYQPGKEPQDGDTVQAIAHASKELVEQRDAWLNTEGLDENGKKRTLTNLYNKHPTWLELAHKRLDDAVFAAYGWQSDLSDEEILSQLLALNLERAAGQ